ncbi:hypothetical protein OEIGOIKO_05139 [Streptomyces chrestomyceticus JCM 4735]|uniref:Uncharacterized protein n=1 Tax=Streptomyces chrestomyceticus JCM 4735 TaxID=1306181 RepID=A0A7U9KXU1_9ACTN|nr:hypothetical protein OEIGOIKO_05139 [Streptomyces chrestomyceticus JCM 4735]
MSDADRPDRSDRRNSPEDTQPLRVVRPQDRQRWEPLPQGNEYESEATAFVQLPDGFTSGPYPGGYGYQGYPDPHGTGIQDAHGVPGAGDHGGYAADPLAAPGHGYTPPSSFAPPTPGATTDPSATGQWTMPFADAPATDLPAHGLPDGGPHTGVPGGHYTDGTDGSSHTLWPAAGTDGSSGTTGQWAIPTAPDEVLEESGEYLLGDDRTHPASGYGTAYGPYDHGHGHGHAPVDPAATGQWHFTTDQHTPDQHTGAGHLPYGQQPHRPADQVTPGYDPGHHVPASGDTAGGTLGGGAGNWSLPADALAQWPPRSEPVEEPRDAAPAEPQDEVAAYGDGLPQQETEPGSELTPESVTGPEPEPEAGGDAGQAAQEPVSGPIALGPVVADASVPGADESGTPAAGVRTDTEARTDEATGEAPVDAAAEAAVETGASPEAETRAATDVPPAADGTTPETEAGTEPEPEPDLGTEPGTAPGTDAEVSPAEPADQATPDASDVPTAAPVEPAADVPTDPAPVTTPDPAPVTTPTESAAEQPPAAPEPAPETTPPPADDTTVSPTPADDPATDPLPLPHDEHPHTSYVLSVNGTDRPVTDAWIGESLLYVLRERLGLAGPRTAARRESAAPAPCRSTGGSSRRAWCPPRRRRAARSVRSRASRRTARPPTCSAPSPTPAPCSAASASPAWR